MKRDVSVRGTYVSRAMAREMFPEINWSLFCMNSFYSRYPTQTPFWHGGYLYASDGNIIVRKPKAAEPVRNEGVIPPIVHYFDMFDLCDESFEDWPGIDHVVLENCPCYCTVVADYEFCPVCYGSGLIGFAQKVGSLNIGAGIDQKIRTLESPKYRIEGKYVLINASGAEAVALPIEVEDG